MALIEFFCERVYGPRYRWRLRRSCPQPFDLVVLASRRAREIASGASITVPRDNDKNPVVALREIAEKTISVEYLQEEVIRGMQRVGFIEESESDLDDEGSQEFPVIENALFDVAGDDDLDEEDDSDVTGEESADESDVKEEAF